MIRDNDPSFKLIGLVVSVCLTVFLISSCSDNNTESGMELGLAGADVEPTAADNFNVEGSIHNRSASCNLVFSGTKYVDHKLHKVLANCDSVNKVYAYHGRTESTVTLTQWLKNWCTSQHGSTTTIIDTNEQQCSSGTGAYNSAAVGYVNKYSDLLRVYNARVVDRQRGLGERIIIVIAAVEKVVHSPVCPLQTVVRLQPLQVVGQVEITTIFASTTNVQNSRIGYDVGHQQ